MAQWLKHDCVINRNGLQVYERPGRVLFIEGLILKANGVKIMLILDLLSVITITAMQTTI